MRMKALIDPESASTLFFDSPSSYTMKNKFWLFMNYPAYFFKHPVWTKTEMGTTNGVISYSQCQVDYTELLPSLEGAAFCHYWNRHMLKIWIWLPCTQCFFQNYQQSTIMVFHISQFLFAILTLQGKKCVNGPMFVEFSGLHPPPLLQTIMTFKRDKFFQQETQQ